MAPGIPTIDLGPFLEADRQAEEEATAKGEAAPKKAELPEAAQEVARQWRAAFSAQGFAQVIGHGVPDQIIEDAYSMARSFFALPMKEKKRCDLGLGYGACGFNAQGVERVSATASRADGSELLGADKARPPDRVESMIIKRRGTDVSPERLEDWTTVMYGYHDEMLRLLRTILRLTACSLDLPLDYFDPYYFGENGVGPKFGPKSFCGDATMRLAYYPAFRDGEEPPPGQLRYGEHTDYTGFTMLWQDHNTAGPQTAAEGLQPPDGGLQVRMPDGSWVDSPPVPKAFTINAGDLIQVWTNDVFLSNTHRVKNPPPGDRHDRLSVVCFSGPDNSMTIEPLPTCCGPDRPAKYKAVSAGEHLARKIAASNK